tara:strand:+ start:216 stop:1469 length:1254 start_codon:yes stop_codon:yes gene_type:complete
MMVDYFKKIMDYTNSDECSDSESKDIRTSLAHNSNLTLKQTELLLSMVGFREGQKVFDREIKEGQHYIDFNYESHKTKLARDTLANILLNGQIPNWIFVELFPENPTETHTSAKLSRNIVGGDNFVMQQISLNKNLSSQQIDYFLNLPNIRFLDVEMDILSNLASRCKLTNEQFEFFSSPSARPVWMDVKYKKEKDSILLNQLCRNSNLNSYQLEKLLDNAEVRSRNLLQKHPLTTAQFKKIITHFNKGMQSRYLALMEVKDEDRIYQRLVKNPYLTEEQSNQVTHYFTNSPLMSQYNIESAKTQRIVKWMSRRQHLSNALFGKLLELNEKDNFSVKHLAENPNLTQNQYLLLHAFDGLRDDLAFHTNFQVAPKLFDWLFNPMLQSERYIRSWVAENTTINPLKPREFASGLFNWKW